MNLEKARHNMVEQQIRPWDVLDQDILDLLYAVPREEFAPAAYRNLAFSDLEIPLGEGESMWAPKIEARVLQELAIQRTERVLEVGTGSGYFTALLAHRAAQVFTVEVRPRLAEFGRSNLERHGRDNVIAELGDGAQGYAKWAPYDVIVLTGSTPILPNALLESLVPGGRLFAVVGDPPAMAARVYTCVSPGASRSLDLFETVIAPLRNCAQPPRFKF